MQLPTQAQFVEDCLAKYRWEPIPSDQKWEAAHYPLPACSGEGDTVLLWSADHTVQGLLQSVELDHQCFYYKANKKDLCNLETYYPQYLPLFQQLKSEFSSRAGKIGGARTAELGIGIFAPGIASANGKIGGKKCAELGLGAHAPGIASAAGKKAAELGVGVHAPGVRSAAGKKSAELGVGIHAPGQKSAGGKITGAQRWQCLVTGFITTPGGLSTYQKARGIDTKLRVKIK